MIALLRQLFVDHDADRHKPNRGSCPVVAASDSMPATVRSLSIPFLLTAREGGLWADRYRQGRNSLSSPLATSISALARVCARRRKSVGFDCPKPAEMAPRYPGC